MKKLLDRFRKKTVQESAAPMPGPAPASGSAAAVPAPPGSTLRTSPAVVLPNMPSWHSASAPVVLKKNAAFQADRKAPAEMLTLTLGDFLPRIPERFLDPGEHDPATPLPFDLAALSERLGRGDSEIFLSEIYRRIPDVFRSDVVIAPHQMVRFPWSRVLALVTQPSPSASSGLSAAGVETLSLKLKARKFRQAATKPAPSLRPPAQKTALAAEGVPPLKPEPVTASLMPVTASAATATLATAPEIPATQAVSLAAAPDSASAAELQQLRTAKAQRIIALRTERDQLLKEATPLRTELAGLVKQSELEREVASQVSAKLACLEKAYAEIVRTVEALQAERDAAEARFAEFRTANDAAVARTGELTAERDAAVTRAAELAAEHATAHVHAAELTVACDAAYARAMVLTCERDTARARAEELLTGSHSAQAALAELAAELAAGLARITAVTAERDSALTGATELTAERDATLAKVTALIAERDTVQARALELAGECEAARAAAARHLSDGTAAEALAAELAAERDAARAHLAELQTAHETPEQAVWESRAAAQFEADIEGYRNRIQALLRERDLLRKEVASAEPEPAPDVYSQLFPRTPWQAQTAAALALVIAGFLFAKQLHRHAAPTSQIDAAVPPAAEAVAALDRLSVVQPKESFPLGSPTPAEPTGTLLSEKPVPGTTAALR